MTTKKEGDIYRDDTSLVSNAFRDLSVYSSFFRDKLIQEFNIIESLDAVSTSSVHGSRYTTRDFIDVAVRNKLLAEAPSAVIWFPGIKRIPNSIGTKIDRRLVRTKNKKFVPIGPWARWLTNDLLAYKMLILLFIVLHGVNVGIMAQFQMQSSLYYSTLQKLEVLDACLLSMFVIDGIIHLLDDWYTYITDGWNILDIGITITIILPGILELIYGVISNPIRALRILSIIKIIIRSESLRTIVITISQAIQSMNYIIMFIAMVGTWFAHVAIYLFSDYVNAEIDGLVFQDYFNSLAASYKTAFILMTLDQWDYINRDLAKVTNPIVSNTFIIFWTWIGAFIFRNIFVGVMIHNFKRISTKLEEEQVAVERQKKLEKMKTRLKNEIAARESIKRAGSQPHQEPSRTENDILDEIRRQKVENVQKLMTTDLYEDVRWNKMVQDTLDALAKGEVSETFWPRDTMFKYLQCMENFTENLQEYQELSLLARKHLMELHDT